MNNYPQAAFPGAPSPRALRQIGLWNRQEPFGAMKKPSADRSPQAPSVVCLLFGIAARFSACYACRPQTRIRCLPNFDATPAPEMTALAVNNAQRYSRISKSPSLSLLKAGIFCVAAYFWSTCQVKPMLSTGGNCLKVHPCWFAHRDSKGMKSLWRRFGPRRPNGTPSLRQIFVYLCLSTQKTGEPCGSPAFF